MPEDPAARLTTIYGQSLEKLGLTNKAQRTEEIGRQMPHRDGNDDKWWLRVSWESGMRTSRGHAERLAREQVKWFGCIRELLGERFGVFSLSFPLSLDPKRGTEKLSVFGLRGYIKRLFPNSWNKIVGHGDNLAIRGMTVEPITPDQIALLESVCPRNAVLHWENPPAADFDRYLRRMLAPDLPKQDIDRARMEYVMDHIQQVALYGTVYALTRKYKKDIYVLARKSLKLKDRPRNPKTDAIATGYGFPIAKKIPFEDVRWQQYLDDLAEVDATTPAEHAAMLSVPTKPHEPAPPVGEPPGD